MQQDTLHFLHRAGDAVEDSQEIDNGIFWGGNTERVIEQLELGTLNPEDFKFFLGYSGWGGGQLLREVEEKSWIIYKMAKPEQIFDIDPDNLWREVLKSMGGEYKIISNYPTDPSLN